MPLHIGYTFQRAHTRVCGMVLVEKGLAQHDKARRGTVRWGWSGFKIADRSDA